MKKLVYVVIVLIMLSAITNAQDLFLRNQTYNSNGIVFSSETSNKFYISFGRSIVGTAKDNNRTISVVTENNKFNDDIFITNTGEANLLPKKYSLQQNYPNPFNPSTKIKYDIPQQSIVNISIYNILGEKISDLVNDLKNAGSYEITWNAGHLSNGVYIYVMRSTGFIDSKKLILLK